MTQTITNQHISLAVLDDYIQSALNAYAGKSARTHSSSKPNFSAGSETFVRQLCLQAREVFMSQSTLLEVEAPIRICGDFHGQFSDLIRMFQTCGVPPSSNYLFLGDYIDRGRYGVETMCLLLALKVRYPENFFLLRGNHESAVINRQYGFFDECKRKFGKITVWKTFCDVFNCLPLAAVVEDKIFCCHGGLSPEAMTPKDLGRIRQIIRPCEVPDQGVICDLLWSDPADDSDQLFGWAENEDRGISFLFGKDVVDKFLKNNDFDLICRGHQVVESGYQFHCGRKMVTIFSAPNYCGTFENSGAVMSISSELMCSFTIMKPQFKV